MTRVLYLTPGCFDKGGISRYCRYQIEALREIIGSEQVRILSLLGPTHDGFETPFEVTWHGGGSKASFAARCRFVLEALHQTMRWKPDVIHCGHVNFAPLATKLQSLSGATTVLNVYGLELWSGLSKSRRVNLTQIDWVIADCHATADHLLAKRLHPDAPAVIWDCVDLERFCPGPPAPHVYAQYGLPDRAFCKLVLTLGRLAASARHKGYDRLLDIWSDILARVPDARLVIAGQGDDSERLRMKAANLGHADSVTFTGAINEEDLAAIYRAAHVFCLVSDKGPGRGEGIPLTPIEAMASGSPILVGDEDGSREAVDGARNGSIVSPRDPAAMTEALVMLLSETDKTREMRVAQARAVAEERFGYAAFRDKHTAFYTSITSTASLTSRARTD